GSVPEVCFHKYYDVNANGKWDDGEQEIFGWRVHVSSDDDEFVGDVFMTPDCVIAAAGVTYTFVECDSIVGAWAATTDKTQAFTVPDDAEATFHEEHAADFGNVCLGSGGGLTLGF